MYEDDEPHVQRLPDLSRSRAERMPGMVPPAAVTVWSAAEIMHLAGIPALDVSIGAALASALAWGASGHWQRVSRRAAAWTAVTAGWLALGAGYGPLHWWPYPALTGIWAIGSFIAWRQARSHPSVLDAQDWRQQRADWLYRSHRWGLAGSHLLKFERTRLGERYEASTKGTGKRASVIEHSGVAELIAEDRDLPPGRVQVKRHRLAGRIVISVQETDPWAEPIAHPMLDEAPEITLPLPFSIAEPSTVGLDPETGSPLDLLLCGPHGGRNISVVGTLDAGKTTLFNDIAERVTGAYDAVLIKINVSVKGDAEKDLWAPACHLTALGPKQGARAVKVMQVLLGIMEWRSQQPQGANWVPSARDPHIVVEIDEIDEAARIPAFKTALARVASKGREYGITIVRAGQRATADWTGGANTRALDSVFCIGKVRSQSEVYHAVGNLGYDLPDMASFGEGKSGVWVITELGGTWRKGRSFLLKDPDDIRRIAAERAGCQPDLCPELRAFLGESYEILLSTDVFAEWARNREPAAAPGPLPQAPPETSADLLNPLSRAEQDAFQGMERNFHMDIDPETRAKLDAIAAKNANTRRILEQTAAMPVPPRVSREAMAAHTASRWEQAAQQTVIPDEIRARLLELCAGEGMSGRKIADELGDGVKRTDVMWWLHRLRWEGVIESAGKGPASRFRLTAKATGGDGQ